MLENVRFILDAMFGGKQGATIEQMSARLSDLVKASESVQNCPNCLRIDTSILVGDDFILCCECHSYTEVPRAAQNQTE